VSFLAGGEDSGGAGPIDITGVAIGSLLAMRSAISLIVIFVQNKR